MKIINPRKKVPPSIVHFEVHPQWVTHSHTMYSSISFRWLGSAYFWPYLRQAHFLKWYGIDFMLTLPEQSSPVQKACMKWWDITRNLLFPSFNQVCIQRLNKRGDYIDATLWSWANLLHVNKPVLSVSSFVLTDSVYSAFLISQLCVNNPYVCFFTNFSCGLFGFDSEWQACSSSAQSMKGNRAMQKKSNQCHDT